MGPVLHLAAKSSSLYNVILQFKKIKIREQTTDSTHFNVLETSEKKHWSIINSNGTRHSQFNLCPSGFRRPQRHRHPGLGQAQQIHQLGPPKTNKTTINCKSVLQFKCYRVKSFNDILASLLPLRHREAMVDRHDAPHSPVRRGRDPCRCHRKW